MPRLTAACPDAHRAAANQLACALGASMADANTYGPPTWQDGNGALYACASVDVGEEWLAAAQQPLTRPEWDTDEQIDMAAAAQAQALIALWTGEGEPPLASPGALTVIVGMEGVDAVAAMGLTQISGDLA
jgi:hypothetical protein